MDRFMVQIGEQKYIVPGTEGAGPGWFVVRPDGTAVCWVEHVEDANLFAGSNDLLEALTAFRAQFDPAGYVENDVSDAKYREAARLADFALAIVRGES